jgi:hypothetical protein
MLARSATGTTRLARVAACLAAGMLSPVSADSSTDRRSVSTSRASAATYWPADRARRSPTTTSSSGMRIACPSRITVVVRGPEAVSEAMVRSA